MLSFSSFFLSLRFCSISLSIQFHGEKEKGGNNKAWRLFYTKQKKYNARKGFQNRGIKFISYLFSSVVAVGTDCSRGMSKLYEITESKSSTFWINESLENLAEVFEMVELYQSLYLSPIRWSLFTSYFR